MLNGGATHDETDRDISSTVDTSECAFYGRGACSAGHSIDLDGGCSHGGDSLGGYRISRTTSFGGHEEGMEGGGGSSGETIDYCMRAIVIRTAQGEREPLEAM